MQQHEEEKQDGACARSPGEAAEAAAGPPCNKDSQILQDSHGVSVPQTPPASINPLINITPIKKPRYSLRRDAGSSRETADVSAVSESEEASDVSGNGGSASSRPGRLMHNKQRYAGGRRGGRTPYPKRASYKKSNYTDSLPYSRSRRGAGGSAQHRGGKVCYIEEDEVSPRYERDYSKNHRLGRGSTRGQRHTSQSPEERGISKLKCKGGHIKGRRSQEGNKENKESMSDKIVPPSTKIDNDSKCNFNTQKHIAPLPSHNATSLSKVNKNPQTWLDSPLKISTSCPDLSMISEEPLTPFVPLHRKSKTLFPASTSPSCSTNSNQATDNVETGSIEDIIKNAPLGHSQKTDSPLHKTPLHNIPASNNPASEEFIKKLMESMMDSIKLQLESSSQKTEELINTLNKKFSGLEQKVKETVESHNKLIDAHYSLEEEVTCLKDKIADMEDRDRRCNIKFRGISEKVTNNELNAYVTKLMHTIHPQATRQDLMIERVHRLYKPTFLPDSVPRDVLAKLHYFPTKEAIIQKANKQKMLPPPYSKIKIFVDLSAATLKKRKEFQPVTSYLRDNNVLYRWGFPTKLLVVKNNITYALTYLKNTNYFLNQLGLRPMDEKDLHPMQATLQPNQRMEKNPT